MLVRFSSRQFRVCVCVYSRARVRTEGLIVDSGQHLPLSGPGQHLPHSGSLKRLASLEQQQRLPEQDRQQHYTGFKGQV